MFGPVEGERDLGGGLEACEEDGSGAGEGGKRGEACGRGEEGGDAGVCIAACKSLASRRPVAAESVDLQTFWRQHHESISLGMRVSASLSSV